MSFDANSYGYTVSTYDEVVSTEPISVEEVKDYIGVNFEDHDESIKDLITSCRYAAEYHLDVTLIESRTVNASWIHFVGEERLPFPVITGGVIAKSLNGSEEYSPELISGPTGIYIATGRYASGVSFTYRSERVSDGYINAIKPALVRSVAELFENQSSDVNKVIRSQLKGFKYMGSFQLPS